MELPRTYVDEGIFSASNVRCPWLVPIEDAETVFVSSESYKFDDPFDCVTFSKTSGPQTPPDEQIAFNPISPL
jgi:hypothetical protein